jgi:hypothetical protein
MADGQAEEEDDVGLGGFKDASLNHLSEGI